MEDYGLKYYHYWGDDGLKIYEKGYTGGAQEIEGIQALTLGFISDEAPDAPIVKSEAQIVLTDAPDLVGNSVLKKSGDWHEFYTQDPLRYKVEITSEFSSNANNARWTGYIVPDLWKEALEYRNAITLSARDNLGLLNDTLLDPPGQRVSFSALLNYCEEAIGQRIWLGESVYRLWATYNYNGNPTRTQIGNIYFKASELRDRSLGEVLEDWLTCLGMTIRWREDLIGITTIGALATETKYYYITELGEIETKTITRSATGVIFKAGAEHRYNTGFKYIKDTINYEYDEGRDIEKKEFTGGSTSAFAPGGLPRYGDNQIPLRINNAAATIYTMLDAARTVKVSLKIATQGAIYFSSGSGQEEDLEFRFRLTHRAGGVEYFLYYTGGASTAYGWRTAGSVIAFDVPAGDQTEESFSFIVPYNATNLRLEIFAPRTTAYSYSGEAYHALINSVSLEYTLPAKTETHKVITENTQQSCIKFERDTKLGQYIGVADAAPCVKNIMTTSGGEAITGLTLTGDGVAVRWPDIMAQTHQQLLCAYGETTHILEGDPIVEFDNNYPQFSQILGYPFASGTRYFIPTAGKIDIIRNQMSGAVLRQVASFDNVFPVLLLGAYEIVFDRAEDGPGTYGTGLKHDDTAPDTMIIESDWDDTTANCYCVLYGRVRTSNVGWVCPRLPVTDRRGTEVEFNILRDYQNKSLYEYPFSMKIYGNMNPGHNTLTFGPLYYQDGDDGGPFRDEQTTIGHIYLDIVSL